ncbi:hypothetical protein V6Z11_D07G170200 [Gossypium hirsutum]
MISSHVDLVAVHGKYSIESTKQPELEYMQIDVLITPVTTSA